MVPIRWVATLLARAPRHRALWAAVLLAGGMFGVVLTVLAQTGTPTIQFTQASYTFNRSDIGASITVTLSSPASSAVTVQVSASDGTAKAGEDYGWVADSVLFDVGSTSQTISLLSMNNGETVPEFYTVTLSNPSSNAILGAPSSTTIILGAGSQAGVTVVFESATYSCSEGDPAAIIGVKMTGTPTGAVWVYYSTSDGTGKAGTNYAPSAGWLKWDPSNVGMAQFFTVAPIPDGQVDSGWTVNLTLSMPVNATLGSPSTAVLTINDADQICP